MFYAGIMEEVFFLYHDSHPQGHLSICPEVRSCLPKSPYGLVLVPVAKDLVQLMTNLQLYASSQSSLSAGLDFLYPTTFTTINHSLKLQLLTLFLILSCFV